MRDIRSVFSLLFFFLFLHLDTYLFSTVSLKDYPFSIELLSLICQWSLDYLCGSASGLSVLCSIDICVYSFINTMLF